MNFRGDESLMTAGLDEWPFATETCPKDWYISEERLQSRLNVSHFRLPPDFREAGIGINLPNQRIPYVRFPQWHYCPWRGAMEKLPLYQSRIKCPCRPDLDCFSRPKKFRPQLIPSRFIAICPKGHIDDFPFMEWVHRDKGYEKSTCKLRLRPGHASASLSGVRISCSCGASRSMAGTFNFDSISGGALHRIGYDCSGRLPWLGDVGSKKCGEFLRVVQRGASNVYFPISISSIYLPMRDENPNTKIMEVLEDPDIWKALTASLGDKNVIQNEICETVAILKSVDAVELLVAAQKKLDGMNKNKVSGGHKEEEFKRQEYDALRTGLASEKNDLMVDVCSAKDYGKTVSEYLENVCLVRKLRETRAFVGFSRLLPSENLDLAKCPPISEKSNLGWLPAIVVHGEGIFIEFNYKKIVDWAQNHDVQRRIDRLMDLYNRVRLERGMNEVRKSPKYMLLHTFAHQIIRQLIFDCGYGGAALRERIYCESEDSSNPMQGILIYTASGDSEGTLGGLVRQGEPENLQWTIERAIHDARWCSSDPICIESAGQGSDNSNLAACHSCVLLPETSCETGNRFLDRALLVGSDNDPEIGFFKSVL